MNITCAAQIVTNRNTSVLTEILSVVQEVGLIKKLGKLFIATLLFSTFLTAEFSSLDSNPGTEEILIGLYKHLTGYFCCKLRLI